MSGVESFSPRLGVNVDHVATLRQARGEVYPSVVQAAKLALESGADQITIHLREDRRHIQDADVNDVFKLVKENNSLFNFEIGASDEMVDKACHIKPDWVCLVPEKREEKTTEGGLNLLEPNTFKKIQSASIRIKEITPQTKISLFVESKEEILRKVSELKNVIDGVEIHTGDYAICFNNGKPVDSYFDEFKAGKKIISESGLSFHAGHGLTKDSLIPLVKLNLFSEYNIGHWIISESIFQGLGQVVKDLKNVLS